MERLIWQPGCRACEGVRDRIVGRRDLRLVAGLFPPTPHERHGYTIILKDGSAITGLAAARHVRRWSGPSRGATLLFAATVLGLSLIWWVWVLSIPFL